jgi:hypothetical protein
MSNNDALGELAALVGKPSGSLEFEAARRRAVNGFNTKLEMRPLHRRASDLLGVVLALSARTRRVIQPKVGVDLDVFTPLGRRAVVLHFGHPV